MVIARGFMHKLRQYLILNCFYFKLFKFDTPYHIMCFCTQDRAMDPTFQMKYLSVFKHVLSQRNKAKTEADFSGHPVKV